MATCKGTLAHYAFEKIFDHPREERVADNAVGYVREHWEQIRSEEVYAPLLNEGDVQVEQMLCEAEDLVRRWFSVERPHQFDPEGRELYLRAEAAGIEVHGYIDRLDKIVDTHGAVRWIISDYKTGKPPREPYIAKAFFAMNVYALLAREQLGIDVSKLRLVYVKNGLREDIISQAVTDDHLRQTEKTLDTIWRGIQRHASQGVYPARKSVLCQWCHFQPECPSWATELANVPIADRNGDLYPR